MTTALQFLPGGSVWCSTETGDVPSTSRSPDIHPPCLCGAADQCGFKLQIGSEVWRLRNAISALREQSSAWGWDCWDCRQLSSSWFPLLHWGRCGSWGPDRLTGVVVGVWRGTGGSHPHAVQREKLRSTTSLIRGCPKDGREDGEEYEVQQSLGLIRWRKGD